MTVKLCSLPPFTTVIRQKLLQFCRETVLSCLFTALKNSDGKLKTIEKPQLILFSALNPPPGKNYGHINSQRTSGFKFRTYENIQMYRSELRTCGKRQIRRNLQAYRETYPKKAFTKDRAMQIAKEWSDGMNAAKNGDIRDFVAVGDVDIKVIGADNQLFDTEVPVRQILEQLIAKLSVPPFLLGLNWSTTERMSSQQADILTSELEYYRRLLTPVIRKIAVAFLRLQGSDSDVDIIWDNINFIGRNCSCRSKT